MEALDSLKNIKCIETDGRQQIQLIDAETVYIVKKGKVFLYFTELNKEGVNKRKHFIKSFEKDEVFSGCLKDDNGIKYTLVTSGEVDTQVYEITNSVIDLLEDKTAKKIIKKINNFYLNILDDKTESNSAKEMQYFDTELIRQNNYLCLERIKQFVDNKIQKETENIQKRTTKNKEFSRKSISSIVSMFQKKHGINDEDIKTDNQLYNTCNIVCKQMKIEIAKYEDIKKCTNNAPTVEDIARVSKFPIRDVILEENWWKVDNGPLLLFAKEDDRPLACIPISPSKYKIYDVKNKTETVLTSDLAQEIIPRGYMFYRPFPNKKLKYKDILYFGVAAAWKRDIVRVLVLMLIGTLIGLLLPELNQKIFDDYIPEGDGMQLLQVGLLILAFMIGNFLVSLTKAFSTFRASNRMEYGIQGAIFDRIVNFPGKFYSQFTSGELSSRAMGITQIFNTLADVVVSTVLSALFSALYLWRMFNYNRQLSLLGIILVLITVGITLVIGVIQLKYEKKLIDISNKLAGFMYQLLLGISKIRISGSEDRAVYKWNTQFLKARQIVVDKQKLENIILAFNNMLNTIFSILIYYMVIVKKIEVTFGAFMAFTAAFGSFSGAMIGMAETFIKINRLIPIYEKAKPILETTPEYEDNMEVPGELAGEIDVSNLNFRYSKDGALILDNMSFSIKPGEYVGIVGPSGGGKSTLFKILLGFEAPDTGKVFYDDKDLESVDKRELRKKLGVVLQDGQLIAGSIYENITITNNKISMKRVREVVKEAGLEEDIAKMPMGLHTMLMEDAGTISGGQKQRILIARAIANKPKIVFFDEATSALDNLTQAIVCDSLEKLSATRIVIAHRLSTIVNCDRILVIDKGKIVEQGTYDELMKNEGMFYKLASRQIA